MSSQLIKDSPLLVLPITLLLRLDPIKAPSSIFPNPSVSINIPFGQLHLMGQGGWWPRVIGLLPDQSFRAAESRSGRRAQPGQ
ncbi:MAG: hypothetical protein IPO69_17380 [Saprospiraceae bacterium]|nr:hypothetical protein [Saprospiraceae bacterium]